MWALFLADLFELVVLLVTFVVSVILIRSKGG